VVISQGDVCWATLDDPVGSSPGFRRPVAIVQGDSFNASRLATTVVVPLTSNLRLAAAPGNVVLTARRTGLPKDSVANVSQIITVDRALLADRVGRLGEAELELVLAGIDVVLGRE
jgi:mRNA interferase MazF